MTEICDRILERAKSYTYVVLRRNERRMLIVLMLIVLGFAFCFIILGTNISKREKSVHEEIETLEKEIAALELSFEETNGKIDGSLKEISEALAEISSKVTQTPDSANEIEDEFLLPQLDTSFKSYMDYRTITCAASDQYVLQQQAYTDELGLRRIGRFYCIALGTYYSSQCGEKFKICTDNGNEFYVIVSDIKDDRHTDESNMYVPLSNGNANVVEFIVDTPAMERRVALLGDISGYEQFSGNIAKIERV